MNDGLRQKFYRSIITLVLTVPTITMGAPPCENLHPQSGEFGYKVRGERCEGMFIQDILSNIRLKSLLAIPRDASKPEKDAVVAKLYPGIPASQYQLRVSSMDPRIHYQLDAFIPEKGEFRWPSTDILTSVVPPISKSILAPLAWNVSEPAYYVPVLFPQTEITLPSSEVENVVVIFESTVPIQQYAARLISDESGRREELTNSTNLPTSRLELAIPRHDQPGFHTLWLRVRLLGESQPEGQSWMLWLP